VFHDEDSFGSKSGNGSWSGIVEQVISGIADIGIGDFVVTKERSELATFTDPLGLIR
jgi:ABC-type amino acid transport substrate-binding protein